MATLSAVLTNYNHSKEIGRAIECIVNQSRLPDEFVIQDDGSTDNSVDIISSYAEKYPFIKFYKNDKNLGPIPAMRKVLEYATCEYVYSAGADDWVLQGFFEKAMDMAEVYPDAGMCCGDMVDYMADTGMTSEYAMLWSDTTEYFSPEKIVDLLAGRSIPGQACIIKRSALVESGGFIPELKWHSDWFFNHVIAFRYGVVYIPELFAVETARSPGSYCFEGSRNGKLQEEVMVNAIRLLKSPRYRDVLPSFIRSAAFFPFSYDAVRAVMRKKEFWDIETVLLLQHPLHCWNTNVVVMRNQRAKKSVEKSITGLLKKVELLIDRGKNEEAKSFLNEIEDKFGSNQGILALQRRVSTSLSSP